MRGKEDEPRCTHTRAVLLSPRTSLRTVQATAAAAGVVMAVAQVMAVVVVCSLLAQVVGMVCLTGSKKLIWDGPTTS